MTDRRDASRPFPAREREQHPAERFAFYMEATGLALLYAAAALTAIWSMAAWIIG